MGFLLKLALFFGSYAFFRLTFGESNLLFSTYGLIGIFWIGAQGESLSSRRTGAWLP